MRENPFNITKAVDYSDDQINKLWVDMPGESSFSKIIKPTSPMPMILIGGKGCGKTHMMRYFSYNLQKIRHINEPLKGIKEDGYLGIYMRCSGLNSNRFSGKGQSTEVWYSIFSYYMELWIAQLLLTNLNELINQCSESKDINEEEIVTKILNQFDKAPSSSSSVKTLNELNELLKKCQKQIDYEVNNCALTGDEIKNVDILITSGKLIFGIPQIITDCISSLKGVNIIYLIDEFENLSINQQKYINTLIREKEMPATFRIGARPYGIRTYLTFSADEELKEGSEYEKYIIDNHFRKESEDYEKFIRKICVKRLEKSGIVISEGDLDHLFEEPRFEDLIDKKSSKKKPHFITLNEKLKSLVDVTIRGSIIDNLTFDSDLLLERTNVFIFYKEWKKGKNSLEKISLSIKESCDNYIINKDAPLHKNALDYFKSDIKDQILREHQEGILYCGISNYIKMSSGIARHFLIILKHIYRWSSFNDEQPFQSESKISYTSQRKGLKDASDWFIENARIPGKKGNEVQLCMNRLGDFLREIRFSDAPPECSISTFSISTESLSNLSDDSKEILDYLEQYSYILKKNNRRDKNNNKQHITFQINGMLSPSWELSINRRGKIKLTNEETISIFTLSKDSEYKSILSQKRLKYNAPFKGDDSPTLFE